MSKEKKPNEEKPSPSTSLSYEQVVVALAEGQKKIADALNQQTVFSEGLAERVQKIEQSLAGLTDVLKSAAAKPGGADNPLLQIILAGMAREFGGGGGEAEKLIKGMAEAYMKQLTPEAQTAMFDRLIGILSHGVRLGRQGISAEGAKEGIEGK